MATQQQKDAALASLAQRAAIADRNGLPETAKSWRDAYANMASRRAEEIVICQRIEERPEQ